jgi:hypothetical protein
LVAVGVSNSLITENGAGGVVKGGNTGSVAALVVTIAIRGRATVKMFCI